MSLFKTSLMVSLFISMMSILSATHVYAQEAQRSRGSVRQDAQRDESQSRRFEVRRNEMSNVRKENRELKENQIKRVADDKPVSDKLAQERNNFGEKMAQCRKLEDKEARRKCRKEATSANREQKVSGAARVAK